MVAVNPNQAQGFFYFDPMNMGLPGVNSVPLANSTAGNTTIYPYDPSKKIRKPYTITKSRESWTEQEHEKFLEALQLFDRDWKKVEAFVGSKTAIQIRSHAQKYFLKVQKSGTSEHVPPPRPKRKAAHPYPQKAPKSASVVPQVAGPFQSSSVLHEPRYLYRQDTSSVPGNPIASASLSSWCFNSVPPSTVSQVTKDDAVLAGPTVVHNSCHSSSSESTPRTCSFGEAIDRGDHWKPSRVLPDFAQVLLLMRNLSVNLTSPEFEDQRRLLSTYDAESEGVKLLYNDVHTLKSASAVPTA